MITICQNCGTEMVRQHGYERDHLPVTVVISLKRETTTTFIVPPEIERSVLCINSVNAGKFDYELTVPLPNYENVFRGLLRDDRIAEWHTEERPVACDHIKNRELIL